MDELFDQLMKHVEEATVDLPDDDYVEVMQRLAEGTSLAAEVKQEEMENDEG